MDAVSPRYREQNAVAKLDEILTGRDARLAELWAEVKTYATMAEAGLGCAATGARIHKLIDRITTDVYKQTFAYCGRKHTVI
jgi:hypothetical protein